MSFNPATDYQTYQEIIDDLLSPIDCYTLDIDIQKRLYQSKLLYIEKLRLTCFESLNKKVQSNFTTHDYQLILTAYKQTFSHLRTLVKRSFQLALQKITL